MQSIDVGNGIKLAYSESGAGAALLFVHGIPTDYRAWNEQVDQFSPKYRMITYSRRLARPNENPPKYAESTIENNSKDLAGLIKNLGIAPVHLVGHSYGGFTALWCAAKNPDLVRTLTLVDPAVSTLLVKNAKNPLQFLWFLITSPSAAMSAARFQRRSLNPSLAAFKRGDYDAALKLNVDGIMDSQGAYDKFPEPVRIMMKENEKTVGELGADVPVFTKEDASRVSMPTLLINGANSPKFFHEINARLAKSIPKNETARISGSAHFPHVENPAEFNSRLQDFLSKN